MAFPLGGFRQTNATTATPSGPAGGQLSGTYPNPNLAYYTNPFEYGAVGNGVTDDNAALVAALASLAAGGVLDLCGYTFYTSVTVTVGTAGLKIQNGTITTVPAATACSTLIVTGANVTLDNVTCIRSTASSGGGATAAQQSNVVVSAAGFRSYDCIYTNARLACLFLGNGSANRATIIGGSATNSSLVQDSSLVYAAAGAAANTDIRVIGLVGSGGCALGVALYDSQRCAVIGCELTGMAKPAGTVGGYGIMFYNTTQAVRDNEAIGNTVHNTAGFGIYLAADTSGTNNRIALNGLRDVCTGGVQAESPALPWGGIGVNTGALTTLLGNTVKTTGTAPGICWNTGTGQIVDCIVESSGDIGITMQASKVSVRGCRVKSSAAQGFYTPSAAYTDVEYIGCVSENNVDVGYLINGVTGLLVSGCVSRNNTGRGFQVGSCTEASILDCVAHDNTPADLQIYVENVASARVTVDGCRVWHAGANAYGIQLDGGTDCQVRNCDAKGINQAARRIVTANNAQRYAGVYTPTLFNTANVAASTAYECQFVRNGNIGAGDTVTVSGRADVDPTTTLTSTQLGISLPIASNLGAAEDCAGVAFAPGIAAQGAAILGDAANDRALMQWVAGDVTNQAMYFTFTYQVI